MICTLFSFAYYYFQTTVKLLSYHWMMETLPTTSKLTRFLLHWAFPEDISPHFNTKSCQIHAAEKKKCKGYVAVIDLPQLVGFGIKDYQKRLKDPVLD